MNDCITYLLRGKFVLEAVHGCKPIHYGLNPNGGQMVSWVEPPVAGETELILRIKSNCDALEISEMMSTLNNLGMPLTEDLIVADCLHETGPKINPRPLVLLMMHEDVEEPFLTWWTGLEKRLEKELM